MGMSEMERMRYSDMINDEVLNKIKINTAEDIPRLIHALKEISKPKNERNIPPEFQEIVDNFFSYYDEPLMWGVTANNEQEYQALLLKQVADKITSLEQMTPDQIQSLISKQMQQKDQAAQNQAEMAKREAPKPGDKGHVLNEQQWLAERQRQFINEGVPQEVINRDLMRERDGTVRQMLHRTGINHQTIDGMSEHLRAVLRASLDELQHLCQIRNFPFDDFFRFDIDTVLSLLLPNHVYGLTELVSRAGVPLAAIANQEAGFQSQILRGGNCISCYMRETGTTFEQILNLPQHQLDFIIQHNYEAVQLSVFGRLSLDEITSLTPETRHIFCHPINTAHKVDSLLHDANIPLDDLTRLDSNDLRMIIEHGTEVSCLLKDKKVSLNELLSIEPYEVQYHILKHGSAASLLLLNKNITLTKLTEQQPHDLAYLLKHPSEVRFLLDASIPIEKIKKMSLDRIRLLAKHSVIAEHCLLRTNNTVEDLMKLDEATLTLFKDNIINLSSLLSFYSLQQLDKIDLQKKKLLIENADKLYQIDYPNKGLANKLLKLPINVVKILLSGPEHAQVVMRSIATKNLLQQANTALATNPTIKDKKPKSYEKMWDSKQPTAKNIEEIAKGYKSSGVLHRKRKHPAPMESLRKLAVSKPTPSDEKLLEKLVEVSKDYLSNRAQDPEKYSTHGEFYHRLHLMISKTEAKVRVKLESDHPELTSQASHKKI